MSIPPMSLGTANSLLAQYIRELDVFLEILQAPRGKSRDCWDDALVLLIDHLGHKGRLRRGALERVAQAFAHMGHCVNSESLRTRYELLKQEEWAPVGLRDMWEKQLSGWIESQTSLTPKQKSRLRAEGKQAIESHYKKVMHTIREARAHSD